MGNYTVAEIIGAVDIIENGTISTTTYLTPMPGINWFTCSLIIFSFGAIAAFISKTIAAPIERIKLIQQ